MADAFEVLTSSCIVVRPSMKHLRFRESRSAVPTPLPLLPASTARSDIVTLPASSIAPQRAPSILPNRSAETNCPAGHWAMKNSMVDSAK
jgi:hypothetical protein